MERRQRKTVIPTPIQKNTASHGFSIGWTGEVVPPTRVPAKTQKQQVIPHIFQKSAELAALLEVRIEYPQVLAAQKEMFRM